LDDSLPLIEGVSVPPPNSLKQARLISHLDFDLSSFVSGIDGNTPRVQGGRGVGTVEGSAC